MFHSKSEPMKENLYENSCTTKDFSLLFIVSDHAQSFFSEFSCMKMVHIKMKIVRSVPVRETFWSLSLRETSYEESESAVESCVHTI